MRAPERRGPGLRMIPILLVILTLVLAACAGAGGATSAIGGEVGAPVQAAPTMAPAEPEAERAASGDGAGVLPGEDGGNPPSAVRDDLAIVYTGSLQLVVTDLQAALAKAKAAIAATGGYVGASQESNDEDYAVATITYRIPASRWEDAIASLRDLSTKVVAEQTQATEVGGQLVDLEARIRNLRASEASLQQIASGTGKISDLLEVEAQLTQVRGEIEQLEGQQARLEDQVAYGTLVTTFGTEVVQVQQTAQQWDPASDVDAALATLVSAGQSIVSVAIWFVIVWLPVIAVIVLLALLARWAWRRFVPATARPSAGVPGWGEGPGGS